MMDFAFRKNEKYNYLACAEGVLNMVETRIYIGLNDLTTNTQLFEDEKYIRILRNVCYSYKVPFSFNVQEGGYIYENGEYARETSLVLTLINVDKTVVSDIAKDLCVFFHQESVLVAESQIHAHFVCESLQHSGSNPDNNQTEVSNSGDRKQG